MFLRVFQTLLVMLLAHCLSAPLYGDAAADADALIKKRHFSEAITLLQEQIKKDPSYAELYFQLGRAYFLKGDHDQALKELQNCLDRKRKHEGAQYYIALAYIEKQEWEAAKKILEDGAEKSKNSKGQFLNGLGLYHLARKELSEADLAFRRALIEEPNNCEYERNLADVNFENGVYGLAISGYEKVLKCDSTDVTAHFKHGKAYFQQRDWEKALQSLSKAIALDSNYLNAYHLSGTVYMILGDGVKSNGNGGGDASNFYKNAVWMLEKYLFFGGKDTGEVNYWLGRAYYHLNAYSRAVETLSKAISMGFDRSTAYDYKAKSLFRLKRYDEADGAYNDYEKKITGGDSSYRWTADNYDYLRERAQTYYQLYEITKKEGSPDSTFLEKAIPYYMKAIEVKDTDSNLYEQLGFCYLYQKRYQEAIPWFQRKLEKTPEALNTMLNVARCYFFLKDTKSGIDWMMKITEINPSYCAAYDAITRNYLQPLDRAEATKWAKKWAECDSAAYEPYKWLGYVELVAKPVNKEGSIGHLLKAWRLMEAKGVDKCKEIDIITWLAQLYNMYDESAKEEEALKWINRGLGCDPNNKTLQQMKKDLE